VKKTKKICISLIIAIILVSLGLVIYKYYSHYFQINQLLKNPTLVQSEGDKKTVIDYAKNNLEDYFNVAKLVYPDILLDKANILSPFKVYYLSLSEIKSSKSDYELISQFKPSGNWYVPIQWSDNKGSIVSVAKSGNEWKFDEMILDVAFVRIQEGLKNAKLGWGSSFYFANVYSRESPTGNMVIFLRKGLKLQAIPINVMSHEPKPIPALMIGDLLESY